MSATDGVCRLAALRAPQLVVLGSGRRLLHRLLAARRDHQPRAVGVLGRVGPPRRSRHRTGATSSASCSRRRSGCSCASEGAQLIDDQLLAPLAIASFVIGRELTIWFGAWVAARGQARDRAQHRGAARVRAHARGRPEARSPVGLEEGTHTTGQQPSGGLGWPTLLALSAVAYIALVIVGLGMSAWRTNTDVIATPGLGSLPGIVGVIVSAPATLRRSRAGTRGRIRRSSDALCGRHCGGPRLPCRRVVSARSAPGPILPRGRAVDRSSPGVGGTGRRRGGPRLRVGASRWCAPEPAAPVAVGAGGRRGLESPGIRRDAAEFRVPASTVGA